MSKTLRHFLCHLAGREPADTQTTTAERASLTRHASGRKRLVEIGVYEGFTTSVLAKAMAPDGILHAVDPFWGGRLGICWSKWIAHREVMRAKAQSRVRFVEKLSYEAALIIPGEFDFVFIDGDHSAGGIRRDWSDWSPRICPGGIVALHDTRVPDHNPHVVELGSFEFFVRNIRDDRRFEIVEQVDSLSILQRRHSAAVRS